jgi:putative tryptophan/tyrosine transport system substrate-binding protein
MIEQGQDAVEGSAFTMPWSASQRYQKVAQKPSTLGREPRGSSVVMPDQSSGVYYTSIISLAARYHVPAIYHSPGVPRNGGLISYGPDDADIYRGAASYVDHILRGTEPSDLPVQLPTKFELVINLKTATALGLTVPQSILLGADEVIE